MTTLITIPVYYTQQYKTKDDKTLFLGLNWFRNAFFHQQNQVKRDMHELIATQLSHISPMPEKYSVSYFYYYKSPVSDLPNVGPMASKWILKSLSLWLMFLMTSIWQKNQNFQVQMASTKRNTIPINNPS